MKTVLIFIALLSVTASCAADDWYLRRALLPEDAETEGRPQWEVDIEEQDDGDLSFEITEPEDVTCQGAILIAKRIMLPASLRRDKPVLLPRIELNYTSECAAEDASGYVGAFVLSQDDWERYTEGDETDVPWEDPEEGFVRDVHKDSDPDVTKPETWTGPRYPHRIRYLYDGPIYVGIVLKGLHVAEETWTGELQVRLSEIRIPRWTATWRTDNPLASTLNDDIIIDE
ncbi:MAG: hypothetical protein GF320_01960 [Armatimonadia bacterium]|nr:hypothetical protein [Armatimonadia bacterium]